MISTATVPVSTCFIYSGYSSPWDISSSVFYKLKPLVIQVQGFSKRSSGRRKNIPPKFKNTLTVIKSTFLMIVFVNCSCLCMFCLAEKKNIKSANTVSFSLMSQLEACSGSSFDSLIWKCQSSN